MKTQLFVGRICGVNFVQIKLEVGRKHKASSLQELKYPKSKNKKKDFCGFEPAKMHCEFLDVTNAFQMKFDELSNQKVIKEIV